MKKSQIFLIGLLILTLVAIFTNPDTDQHREAVKTEFLAEYQKKMATEETNNEWGQMEAAIGSMFGNALIGQLLQTMISSENYLLFSLTKVTLGDQSRVIGVGLFGNVFISGEATGVLDQIDQ